MTEEPLGNLSNGEISYIIELLAAMTTSDEIQEKFTELSPGKSVSKETVREVSARYCKKISEMNALYLKNIKGNPLAHQRIRLDILNRIVNQCMTKEPSHSIKVADDSYEVVKKADYPTAINALKLVMADLNKREELDTAKEKVQLENTPAAESWAVDDGVES